MAAEQDDILRQLEMRPRIYCQIYACPWTIMRSTFKTQENIINSLVSKIGPNNLVGAVQSLKITTKREAEYRRELNTDTAGRPVEVVPGLPEYNLELSRVVLYESTIAQAFGYSKSYDIMKQNSPLMLYIDVPGVERESENGNTLTVGAKTIMIYGVWFDNNNMDFSVERANDMMIIQRVNAIATGVISTKTGLIETTTRI